MVCIPQIEETKENGMDDEDLMELRGGNIDINGMLPKGFPPIPLEDGLV